MNGPYNSIGWCDYTLNPVKGICPMKCQYCYAIRMSQRFQRDPTIRFDSKVLKEPERVKKPARIFVGSTMELFADEIEDEWLVQIFEMVKRCNWHAFLFLSKLPWMMSQWDWDLSNAWVGTTVERGEALRRVPWLRKIKIPPVRFVSFEPLHSDIVKDYREFQGIDWLIIGAETGNRKGRIVPKEAWIQSILKLADRLKIPVFMKDNLKPYWHGSLRQEFPST